jgi:hypothetical protein
VCLGRAQGQCTVEQEISAYPQQAGICALEDRPGNKRLVLVPGLAGLGRLSAAKSLVIDRLPYSDLLTFDYDARVISNESPYTIANRTGD